jgi:hypothetical protein
LVLAIAGIASLAPSVLAGNSIGNGPPLSYDDIMAQIAQRRSADEVVELTVSDGTTVSSFLDQLFLAQVFRTVACSLQQGDALPVLFRVADSQGTVLAGELSLESVGGCTGFSSILQIAQGFSVLSPSGTELPTLDGVPQTALQAQDRAAAVFVFLTGCTTYIIRVRIDPASAPALAADVSADNMYVVSDIVTGAAPWCVRVREDTQAIAWAILAVLGPDASIAVSQFVDVLGLMYRGAASSSQSTAWNEVFVHPLLQVP